MAAGAVATTWRLAARGPAAKGRNSTVTVQVLFGATAETVLPAQVSLTTE